MNAENSVKEYIVPEGFNMGKWFLDSNLPLSTGAKLTYLVLATCSQKHDYSWASLEFLAKNVSASKRTVRRYLEELAKENFIEITNGVFMGKKRLIFRFLNQAILTFEKVSERRRTPPMRFEDLKKEAEATPPDECQIKPENSEDLCKKNDKNDTRLYKEESYQVKKENNTPPKPPSVESSGHDRTDEPDGGDPGGVGVDFSLPEEDLLQGDPAWAKVKKLLSDKLSKFDLAAYIEPLRFERAEARVVLRAPNRVFLTSIKKQFSAQLCEAFQEAGFSEIAFEEFTPEQRKFCDQKFHEERRRASAMKEAAQQITEEELDFGAFPPEELYNRLYDLYPRHERKRKGFLIFEQLAKDDKLPPMPILMSAVRRQKNNNPKWQTEGGRYIPQLHRWLAERRWED